MIKMSLFRKKKRRINKKLSIQISAENLKNIKFKYIYILQRKNENWKIYKKVFNTFILEPKSYLL